MPLVITNVNTKQQYNSWPLYDGCYNNTLVGHMTSPMDHMIYTLTLDSPQLIKVNNNIDR